MFVLFQIKYVFTDDGGEDHHAKDQGGEDDDDDVKLTCPRLGPVLFICQYFSRIYRRVHLHGLLKLKRKSCLCLYRPSTSKGLKVIAKIIWKRGFIATYYVEDIYPVHID